MSEKKRNNKIKIATYSDMKKDNDKTWLWAVWKGVFVITNNFDGSIMHGAAVWKVKIESKCILASIF